MEHIFFGFIFLMFVFAIVLIVGTAYIHFKDKVKGRNMRRCSVCGRIPFTAYTYETFWGTRIHCSEHAFGKKDKDEKFFTE
jgi:ribosomal protein S14